jgi:formate/nitrite transporter FocA (FNT family)
MTPIMDYFWLALTASVFIGILVGLVFLIQALIRGIGRAACKRDRSE